MLCHWAEDLSWLNAQPFRAVVYEKKLRPRSAAAFATAPDSNDRVSHGGVNDSGAQQDDADAQDLVGDAAAAVNLTSTVHWVPRNVAGEASAFLTFIVDYYDALPKRMVFLHRSWVVKRSARARRLCAENKQYDSCIVLLLFLLLMLFLRVGK